MYMGPVSHRGAEQDSTPVGVSTNPPHFASAVEKQHGGTAQDRRCRAALPVTGLKTDSTVDRRSIVAGRRSGAGAPSPNCPLMKRWGEGVGGGTVRP